MQLDVGRSTFGRSFRAYASAMIVITIAAAIAIVFRRLPHANVPLLFLTAVIIIAAKWGFWPSIFSSVLGFLALNFFYTAPFYTFKVDDEGDVATLIFFLLTAGLTGQLAGKMRAEMATKQAALDRLTVLLEFSRQMAATASAGDALRALADKMERVLNVPTVVSLPTAGSGFEHFAAGGNGAHIDDTVVTGVQSAWSEVQHDEPHSADGWTYLPLATTVGPVGIAAIKANKPDGDRAAMISGLCGQASIAVARILLVDSLKKAQLESETERLRSALLSSVSHDLRTPLASIIGSATSVIEYNHVLRGEDRQALMQTVVDEAQRLNRYIQNLLDMTRFGHGPIQLQREWVDLNDLVASASERLGTVLAHVELSTDIAEDASVVFVHGALLEQVLVNLLDNAAGFTPDGGVIGIHAKLQNERVIIEVRDQGPGIPDALREKVFDLFFRVDSVDRQRAGSGLGLAICRSVITAHDGEIEILPTREGCGTVVRIRLPVTKSARDAA